MVWDDAEVARRWLMLSPERRDEKRQPLGATECEINRIRLDQEQLAAIRSRLSDFSRWMRPMSQNIAQRAKRANQEEAKAAAG